MNWLHIYHRTTGRLIAVVGALASYLTTDHCPKGDDEPFRDDYNSSSNRHGIWPGEETK